MIPNLIILTTFGLVTMAGAGGVKSLFWPPPTPLLAPVLLILAALFAVLALVLWASRKTFDDISNERDSEKRAKLLRDVLEPIFSILKLIPKVSTDPAAPKGG